MHLVVQSADYSKELAEFERRTVIDATVENSQFVTFLPSEIFHDQQVLQSGSVWKPQQLSFEMVYHVKLQGRLLTAEAHVHKNHKSSSDSITAAFQTSSGIILNTGSFMEGASMATTCRRYVLVA